MLNFNKPAGYDEVQASGDFTPIELGGHKLVIKKIEDVSNGVVSYLKVMYDTAQDDIQPNYYAEQYKNDTRDTKKWGGVINIFPTETAGRVRSSSSFAPVLSAATTHRLSGVLSLNRVLLARL